jgi:hypothetical protein
MDGRTDTWEGTKRRRETHVPAFEQRKETSQKFERWAGEKRVRFAAAYMRCNRADSFIYNYCISGALFNFDATRHTIAAQGFFLFSRNTQNPDYAAHLQYKA